MEYKYSFQGIFSIIFLLTLFCSIPLGVGFLIEKLLGGTGLRFSTIGIYYVGCIVGGFVIYYYLKLAYWWTHFD